MDEPGTTKRRKKNTYVRKRKNPLKHKGLIWSKSQKECKQRGESKLWHSFALSAPPTDFQQAFRPQRPCNSKAAGAYLRAGAEVTGISRRGAGEGGRLSISA